MYLIYNQTMTEDDELLDVVDANDQVVGTIKRGETKTLFASVQDRYLRYSCCFLQNDEGRLWIPRRTGTKKIAPNGLDFSASEHVGTGETYLAAVLRGLDEELNIQVTENDIHFVGKVPPGDGRRSFSSIYIAKWNETPNFNRDDFVSFEWLLPTELLERLALGAEAKYDLAAATALL